MPGYPILIPSRGRANNVITVQRFPRILWRDVVLFVPHEELHRYTAIWGESLRVSTRSTHEQTISEKRERMAQWARDNGHEWFYMFDDDLTFFRRRSPDDTRLVMLEKAEDYEDMFRHCEDIVDLHDSVGAVGISIRQGNNNLPYEGAWNTRMIRAGLYNTEAFLSCEHNRLRFMGDFDVMLQMLRRGYDNYVVAKYSQDHRGTNARGGCAHQRTEEVMAEVSHELAALHPGVVRVKQKQNKTGKLAVRTDVTIYWKKARALADL